MAIDPFTLALLALSKNEKRKREESVAESERIAGLAKAKQEHVNAIQIQNVKDTNQTNREVYLKKMDIAASRIESNKVTYLVQDSNGQFNTVSSMTSPEGKPGPYQLQIPEGSKQVGIAFGKATTFQDASAFGPKKPIEKLYRTADGITATAAQHRLRNPQFDLMARDEAGYVKNDGTEVIHTKEQFAMVNDMFYQQVISVAEVGTFPNTVEGQAAAAEAGERTGNQPFLISQAVSKNTGRPLGAPTRVKFEGINIGKDFTETTLTTLHLPNGKKIAQIPANRIDEVAAENNVRIEDLYRLNYTAQVDRDGNVVPGTVKFVGTSSPADVSVDVTEYTLDVGGVGYSGLTLQEAKKVVKDAGFTWNNVDWNAEIVTYVGGEERSRKPHSNNTPVARKRHVGIVTLENGNKVEVQARSEIELIETYGNSVQYLGVFEIINGKRGVQTTAPKNKKALQLIFKDGTTTIKTEDTSPEVLARAVRQLPGEIDSTTGDFIPTSTITDLSDSGKSDAAKLEEAKFAADHVFNFKSDDGQQLGPLKEMSPPEQITNIASKLTPSIVAEINNDENRAAEYVRMASSAVSSAHLAMEREDRKNRPYGTTPRRTRNVYKYAKTFAPSLFLINGMDNALRRASNMEIQRDVAAAATAASANAQSGDETRVVTVPTDTDNAAAMEDIIATPGAIETRDTAAVSYNVPSQYVSFTNQVLAPKLISTTGGNQQLVNAHLTSMFTKKRGPDGEPITNDLGVVEIERTQPIVSVFQKYDAKKETNIQTGEITGTYFDKFSRAVNGDVDGMQVEDYRYFGNTLVKSVNQKAGGIRRLVEIIRPFVRDTPTEDETNPYYYLQPDYGKTTSQAVMQIAMQNGFDPNLAANPSQKAFVAKIGKKESADRVINYANRLLDGYLRTDASGRVVGFTKSSALAELDFSVEGILYLGNEGITRFKSFLGKSDAASGIAEQLTGNIDAYKDNLSLTTGITRIKDEGRAEIDGILTDIAGDIARAGNDKEAQALAVRQLYIVNLAYELSAMMQGGTGGRTISDQDVAIIFRALRQNLLANPQRQAEVIIEVREIARDMRAEMEFATSTDGPTQAAYAFSKALSAVSDAAFHREITPQSIANRINGVSPSTQDEESADPFFGMGQQGYLQKVVDNINENRAATGRPSLDFPDDDDFEYTEDNIIAAMGANTSARNSFSKFLKQTTSDLKRGQQ